MSEIMKDSSFKLFGKIICLLPDKVVSDVSDSEHRQLSSTSEDSYKDESGGDTHEYESTNPTEETLTEAATSSDISDDTKKDDPSSESSTSQEKTLKKPDEILPCPRCKSTDTKFCYYNNYNVNQPRYFCRNCQRYWTSGGTMRNVPVGSGRRKTKNSVVPNFHRILVSDAVQADHMNGIHLSSLKPNSFLIFGSDSQPPGLGSSGFPVGFYPAMPYWGSAIQSAPVSMSTLGKHPRDETTTRPSSLGKENVDGQRSVLIPKTLRIHDPSEAAKSSIWSTLGIKNEKIGSKTGPFKAFESKAERRSSIDNTTMVLQANPAALCRSVNFRESA